LISASRRLIESDGQYALISACAAGGQGSSILLKKIKTTAAKITKKKTSKKTAQKVTKKVAKKTTKKTAHKEK